MDASALPLLFSCACLSVGVSAHPYVQDSCFALAVMWFVVLKRTLQSHRLGFGGSYSTIHDEDTAEKWRNTPKPSRSPHDRSEGNDSKGGVIVR